MEEGLLLCCFILLLVLRSTSYSFPVFVTITRLLASYRDSNWWGLGGCPEKSWSYIWRVRTLSSLIYKINAPLYSVVLDFTKVRWCFPYIWVLFIHPVVLEQHPIIKHINISSAELTHVHTQWEKWKLNNYQFKSD